MLYVVYEYKLHLQYVIYEHIHHVIIHVPFVGFHQRERALDDTQA